MKKEQIEEIIHRVELAEKVSNLDDRINKLGKIINNAIKVSANNFIELLYIKHKIAHLDDEYTVTGASKVDEDIKDRIKTNDALLKINDRLNAIEIRIAALEAKIETV